MRWCVRHSVARCVGDPEAPPQKKNKHSDSDSDSELSLATAPAMPDRRDGAMEEILHPADIFRHRVWVSCWMLDAELGMWPLSWRALVGPGPWARGRFHAEPMERLEEQQVLANMRFAQQRERLVSARNEAASAEQIWRNLHDCDVLDLAEARECCKRREEARHYGMLLCRAFFQPIAMDQIPQEQLRDHVDRLSPDLVELIGQFLNYN